VSVTKPALISDIPLSGERLIATSPRELARSAIPSRWLQHLLTTLYNVDATTGLEASLLPFVRLATELLDGIVVALCIRTAAHEDPLLLCVDPTHIPTTHPFEQGLVFDHTRAELVLPLGNNAASTLHATAEYATALTEGTIAHAFLEQMAATVATVVERLEIESRAREKALEFERLQQMVLQSEKLASLGQIAAGIVHELNNPLSSILAYSDYLRRKSETEGSNPDDVERLKRISAAADRILRFSKDLMTYARPSSGIYEPVGLHHLLQQVLIFCDHILSDRRVTVELDFTEDLPAVYGERGQLTQIFVNLITNACNAMPSEAGHLILRTRCEDTGVHVHIIDNGHGIAAENLTRVFEPFFTTKQEGQGTGLGLSIVRNIVVRHGGTVSVQSQCEQGTHFVVILPHTP